MLIGVFELLSDAMQQMAGVNAAIQALRDFWMAESNLHMSLNGSGSGEMQLAGDGKTMAAEVSGEH